MCMCAPQERFLCNHDNLFKKGKRDGSLRGDDDKKKNDSDEEREVSPTDREPFHAS